LHFRGAGVVFATLELADQLLFPLSGNGHLLPTFLASSRLLAQVLKHGLPTVSFATLPTLNLANSPKHRKCIRSAPFFNG
jgi:hypothetical protein